MNKSFIFALLITTFIFTNCGETNELFVAAGARPPAIYLELTVEQQAQLASSYAAGKASQEATQAAVTRSAIARAGAKIFGLAASVLTVEGDSSPNDPDSDVALANADAKCRANPECKAKMHE